MLPRPAPSSPESLTTAPNDSETGPPQSQIPKRLLHRSRERLVRFDIFGISLGIPGILLLTYSLTSANTSGWSSAQILAPLIISIFLLAAFIIYEQRTAQAILAPHLFRSTSFNLSLGLAVITYAIRQASTYFLTLQLQSYGASPIHTSLLYLPLGISALITNTTVGHLVPIFGARAMVRLRIPAPPNSIKLTSIVHNRLDPNPPRHPPFLFHNTNFLVLGLHFPRPDLVYRRYRQRVHHSQYSGCEFGVPKRSRRCCGCV